ncbi:hypothetical protein J1N35_014203 [Gossypium stocksii]|uniref:Uncharacterized protein n=1 Tax=Gossypium stocksii TaxID=47602 RepID=A0A9D4A9P5_9ROSI|nr:hypothetical protein J1N35_014203 [Gossypium stocksii]
MPTFFPVPTTCIPAVGPPLQQVIKDEEAAAPRVRDNSNDHKRPSVEEESPSTRNGSSERLVRHRLRKSLMVFEGETTSPNIPQILESTKVSANPTNCFPL